MRPVRLPHKSPYWDSALLNRSYQNCSCLLLASAKLTTVPTPQKWKCYKSKLDKLSDAENWHILPLEDIFPTAVILKKILK